MARLFRRTKEALKIFLPPPSNAYLKGHLFPLVASIIKAQVINCFFVIINCEGFPPPPKKAGIAAAAARERAILARTLMPIKPPERRGRGK